MLLSLQKLPQDMFFKKKPCIYHYLNAEFLEIAIIILAHSSFVKLLQIINAHKHLWINRNRFQVPDYIKNILIQIPISTDKYTILSNSVMYKINIWTHKDNWNNIQRSYFDEFITLKNEFIQKTNNFTSILS